MTGFPSSSCTLDLSLHLLPHVRVSYICSQQGFVNIRAKFPNVPGGLEFFDMVYAWVSVDDTCSELLCWMQPLHSILLLSALFEVGYWEGSLISGILGVMDVFSVRHGPIRVSDVSLSICLIFYQLCQQLEAMRADEAWFRAVLCGMIWDFVKVMLLPGFPWLCQGGCCAWISLWESVGQQYPGTHPRITSPWSSGAILQGKGELLYSQTLQQFCMHGSNVFQLCTAKMGGQYIWSIWCQINVQSCPLNSGLSQGAAWVTATGKNTEMWISCAITLE